MDVVEKGLPPTRSGWKLITWRSFSSFTKYFETRPYTVR
jgi:hypothetical protein